MLQPRKIVYDIPSEVELELRESGAIEIYAEVRFFDNGEYEIVAVGSINGREVISIILCARPCTHPFT